MIPPLSVWALRCALAWFVVGFTLGALLLVDKAIGLGLSGPWLQTHMHVLLFGWLVQMVVGVGYWVLPRFNRTRPRRSLAVAAVVLVNVASILAVLLPWLSLEGPLFFAEAGTIIAWAGHAWPRVKAFGV